MDLVINIKSLYARSYQELGNLRRKRQHRLEVKQNTVSSLTKVQVREAKEFYKSYMKITPAFHAFYAEKTGLFYPEYLPDDLYYTKIDTYFNDWLAATIVDNKCYYEKLFHGAKQPATFVYRINGYWFSDSMHMLSKNDVNLLLKQESELFLKIAVDSAGGSGVTYLNGKYEIMKEQFWNTANATYKDIIVQRPIKQHEELSRLNRSSVNTIRILSLLSDSGVKVYSSIIRMGVNGSKVDNASSGGITCGIQPNGNLKDVAYSKTGEKFCHHPTSGVKFSEITVPGYKEARELVMKLHPMIPHFRLVSWDIAIDENSLPILIEANFKYGELDFHQLNNGPLFGNDTLKILNEVFF